MSMWAVHLVMVYKMDTSGFLHALMRMAGCQGTPAEILTGSGTNFVGAWRELCELYAALDRDVLQETPIRGRRIF